MSTMLLQRRAGTCTARAPATSIRAAPSKQVTGRRMARVIASAVVVDDASTSAATSLPIEGAGHHHLPASPVAKKPVDCTMTMSMDDEDECGATTSWDNVPGPMQTQEWADWMGQQLQQQLVGLTARTSRAQVLATGVSSAAVIKGRKRAHEIEFVMDVQGTHLKNKDAPAVTGTLRVALKTVDKRDKFFLSPVEWTASAATPEVLSDISAAAQFPMESALAIRLNDLLWDVERRSMDEMDGPL